MEKLRNSPLPNLYSSEGKWLAISSPIRLKKYIDKGLEKVNDNQNEIHGFNVHD